MKKIVLTNLKKISKKRLFFIIIAFLIFSLIFTFWKLNKKTKIKINDEVFFVEIANNKKERKIGLGKRNRICEKCGMLFIFPEKNFHGFWMKDMKFDLDILWLNDNEIVYIEKNVSSKNQENVYKPNIKSNSVLEFKSGTIDQFKIKIGDKIKLKNSLN